MIVFRKLVSQDSLKYRDLRLESLLKAPNSFGSSYEEEHFLPKLRMQNYIEKESSDQFIFGAFDNGNLIGICGFMREARMKSRHRGTIVQMYIKEEYQRKGIGTRLLRSLIKYSFSDKQIEHLTLGVVTDNEKAINLYQKIGFQAYGVHKKYFKKENLYLDQQLMILYKEEYINE
jgi:RimJ/RimL family protein N-acetyltransferase